MTPIFRNSIVISVLVAGFLSACSPNPYVLQDRVYGSKPAPASAAPAKPVETAPSTSADDKPKDNKTVSTGKSQGADSAEITSTAPKDAEVLEVPSSKTYKSSPAAQALVKQADSAMAKGDFDAAASAVERALRIEPDNPDLWLKLSTINERQGNHEQAASMTNKAKFYQERLN